MRSIEELSASVFSNTSCPSELYLIRSSGTEISVRDGKVESICEGTEEGIGLRVIKDGRLGFAFCSGLSADGLAEKALASSVYFETDGAYSFRQGAPAEDMTSFYDGIISEVPVSDKIKFAVDMERSAYSVSDRVKKTDNCVYSDRTIDVRIMNSEGFSGHYKKNIFGGYASVLCENGGVSEEGYSTGFGTKWDPMLSNSIGTEAAYNGIELLGGQPVGSGNYRVILAPSVASEFVLVISSMVCADNVRKGKSLFAGKLGEKVASGLVTIIDDGALHAGPSSRPFDAEGTPSCRTRVITEGRLTGYLYDIHSANKDKTVSTGNAERGSYRTLPSVSPSNFFITNGITDKEGLISSADNGILVTRVMAMHSVNPVSGDFSVGASGLLIQNGKLSGPVRGITVSGNIADLLTKIVMTGNDLRFFQESGGCGSPSLLIESLSVGGS